MCPKVAQPQTGGGEEGEDSGDRSAVSESSVTQYMCAYEQRRGHAQGVARAQMDDAYLFGKLEDLLLLESVPSTRGSCGISLSEMALIAV
jgi:hypothetical protein